MPPRAECRPALAITRPYARIEAISCEMLPVWRADLDGWGRPLAHRLQDPGLGHATEVVLHRGLPTRLDEIEAGDASKAVGFAQATFEAMLADAHPAIGIGLLIEGVDAEADAMGQQRHAAAESVLSGLQDTEREVVAAMVRDLVVASRVTLREAVDLEGRTNSYDTRRFTGAAVTNHAMTIGAEYLKGLSPSERDRVRNVPATIFKAYLASPETLGEAAGRCDTAIFGLSPRMERLVNRIETALSSFAVGMLLDVGSRPLPSDFGLHSWLPRPEYGIVSFHPVR